MKSNPQLIAQWMNEIIIRSIGKISNNNIFLLLLLILNQNYKTNCYIQMGNTEKSSINMEFQYYEKMEHPHFGQLSPSINSKYPDSLLKVYHFTDQMMALEKIRRFNARIKKFRQSEHIISIKGVQLVSREEMCSHNCDVHLYFEKHTNSLRQVMLARIKEKRVFTQKQIYQFLNQVLEGLIYLQDNGFKNSHLDKDSILIFNDKIKLIDLGIATSSPYQTFLDKMSRAQGFYAAPQLLKDIKDKNYEPYLSPKSDIFCLGMTLLQLACLEPLDSYYDYEKASIDYENLIHRVSRIVYSVQLKTLIASMLEYDTDMRLGLIGAQQQVRRFLNLDKMGQINGKQSQRKRSRSSSTKMLKQLLTSSRKTMSGAIKESEKILTKRPSNASLVSITSMNSRNSVIVKSQNMSDKQSQVKKITENFHPSKQSTLLLKDIVKSKLESRLNVVRVEKVQNQVKLDGKQNCKSEINKDSSCEQLKVKQNIKRMEREINYGYGSNSFLGNNYLASTNFERRMEGITPRINCFNYFNSQTQTLTHDHTQNTNLTRAPEESIFKLIEDNESNSSNVKINMKNKSKMPEFSSAGHPHFSNIVSTTSIKKEVSVLNNSTIREVTQFDDQLKKDSIKSNQFLKQHSESPQHSVSLKVKKSLDKMYKTTKSITSSEEKSNKKTIMKSNTKKIMLENNFFYEGEINERGIFDGNGILYSPEGRIVYSGSWSNGLYDGFGTSYNLEVYSDRVDMKDLSQNTKSWVKYEGEFSKGERQGFGTIYYKNGQRFSGCMKNGLINGYGCFYNNINQMTSGIWINNKLQN